jgi:RNA polymerase sigma-70 factor (ECF subfamily)
MAAIHNRPRGEEASHPQPDDLELLRKARKGSPWAFPRLVDRHAPFLFALAVSLVGNAADAEDVLQETLLGAFRGISGFRGGSSVRTWLARILLRQVARCHRLRARRSTTAGLFDASWQAGPRVAPSAGASDARMDVQAALMALSPEHRAVLVLREWQGLSYEEIAETLEIPRGTVESRIFRARRIMQELLKEYLA